MARLLVFALASCGTSALPEATLPHDSAVVSADGEVAKLVDRRPGLVRRHEVNHFGELSEVKASQRFYGVLDEADRRKKIEHGLAHDHKALSQNGPSYDAPAWAPHRTMPAMPNCARDVSRDMGLSDYGTTGHTCTACDRQTTEANMQQATKLNYLIEPPLTSCNAFDVKFYSNWSNIDQLGCDDCLNKGLKHMFEFKVASNAGDGVAGYQTKDLSFNGWFGPEIYGGPRGAGTVFTGKHIFEIEDTEPPSPSDNCNRPNDPGRWYTVPGAVKAGESFRCERVCKIEHCRCGRKSHTRCEANIAMSSKQVFAYRFRKVADTATGTMDGNSYVGSEWEVTAEDLDDGQTNPIMTIGRVILQGNAPVYGIKELAQSHHHLGHVPCDLFYESTIVTGPFIDNPPGAHVVRSADGTPPPLTAESCELFRISAVGGLAVQFESGPGLWPAYEVNDTILTCNNRATSTCPA